MGIYKKPILDLFNAINCVTIHKTVISEPDLVEFKIGKDHFKLSTDALLDDTAFRKQYIKVKGKLLPSFTEMEWQGFISTVFKRSECCEALELSDTVLTGKMFIDHLNQLRSTKVASDAYEILLDQDEYLYYRFGAIHTWLNRNNPSLGIATFSKVLVELGVKTPGYKVLSFYDKIEGSDQVRTFWEFKKVR
jgi:hypothetical protein